VFGFVFQNQKFLDHLIMYLSFLWIYKDKSVTFKLYFSTALGLLSDIHTIYLSCKSIT